MTTVHIVGAGVAGLALASQLPEQWEIHLHEAAWETRTVPTLFAIQPGGQRALEALGLLEDFRRHCVHVVSGRVSDAHGATLAQVNGVSLELIPRTDLLALLRDRLPDSVRIHRHRVHSVTGVHADLLVGADGVHSVVRRGLWGERAAPRRIDTTVIRGVIDEDPVNDPQEVWRTDGIFGITPRPGGGVNWFSTVPRQRFDDREHALEALRDRWQGYAPAPQEVLRRATPELTLVNDLWESRWPGRLVRSGTGAHAVLLGDAAHAMAPNLGRGANESLVDALVLGSALRAHPLPRALRRYERARLLPAQLIRSASRGMHRVAATRHERLRNTLFTPLPTR